MTWGAAPGSSVSRNVTRVEDDEDVVFAAIGYLVERGEYRDRIPGVAAPSSEDAEYDKVARALHATVGYDRPFAPWYDRNSAAHVAAKAAGAIELLPTPPQPPASESAVAEAEAIIGHRLPPLLRRLYREVANGGFGPGSGLLGVLGGHGTGWRYGSPLDHYLTGSVGDDGGLPRSLFPVCDWGCATTSFVDCSDAAARMWALDPNPVDTPYEGLFVSELTFARWLALWISGRLFQPCLIQDPNTGRWRGATNAESASMALRNS
jgi:hypothetical protein